MHVIQQLTFHDNSEDIPENIEGGDEDQNAEDESADGVCQLQRRLQGHKMGHMTRDTHDPGYIPRSI